MRINILDPLIIEEDMYNRFDVDTSVHTFMKEEAIKVRRVKKLTELDLIRKKKLHKIKKFSPKYLDIQN